MLIASLALGLAPAATSAAAAGAPEITCEISSARWCIGSFDGRISMREENGGRIWSLQGMDGMATGPLEIRESQACFPTIPKAGIPGALLRLQPRQTHADIALAMTSVLGKQQGRPMIRSIGKSLTTRSC